MTLPHKIRPQKVTTEYYNILNTLYNTTTQCIRAPVSANSLTNNNRQVKSRFIGRRECRYMIYVTDSDVANKFCFS